MDLRVSEKKFMCVDYPGIVKNHEAMLQTLGGTANVTKVILFTASSSGNGGVPIT